MSFDFYDWGSWGVGDFYDDTEKELRSALESGKPFDTKWHGFKKEIQSMRIVKTDTEVIVRCSAAMDEIPDIIYDCIEEDEVDMLTDEMIDEITDMLFNSDFSTEESREKELPIDATFDDIVKHAEKLMNGIDMHLDEYFQECIADTLCVLYGYSSDTEKKISERIKKYCGK